MPLATQLLVVASLGFNAGPRSFSIQRSNGERIEIKTSCAFLVSSHRETRSNVSIPGLVLKVPSVSKSEHC